MENKELKPCPFCGNEDIRMQVDNILGDDCRIFAVCMGCGARTKGLITQGLPMDEDSDKVIERWNRRV